MRIRDWELGIGDWGLGIRGWELGKFSSYFTSRLLKLQFPVSSSRKRLSRLRQCCIFFSCLLLLVGCQSKPVKNGITVQVQRVVSGQTIEVLNTNQQPPAIERIRLIGIEAPDLKQQPWGLMAKNHLEKMISVIAGQQLVLQPIFLEPDKQEKDSFGRWLAYVWYDGNLLNEQLVKDGYVLSAPRSPNDKYDERIARAQEYARIMGYGIWNPLKPMRLTPAEFRRLPLNPTP